MVAPESTYKTWLENTEGLLLEDGKLTISCNSIFAIEMLSQRLNVIIKDALVQTSEQQFEIKYVLNGSVNTDQPIVKTGNIKGSWIIECCSCYKDCC